MQRPATYISMHIPVQPNGSSVCMTWVHCVRYLLVNTRLRASGRRYLIAEIVKYLLPTWKNVAMWSHYVGLRYKQFQSPFVILRLVGLPACLLLYINDYEVPIVCLLSFCRILVELILEFT